ncbi:MAG TPA: EamA family transporter [Acidimicrobiales bacterium]|nr:EamA family transporter [Acidimicrobiales bacterium]
MATPDAAALPARFEPARVGAPDMQLSYLAVGTAVFCWGIAPLLVRGISAPSGTIVLYRLWIAFPAMLVLAGLARTPLTRQVAWRAVPAGVMFALSVLTGFASFQQTSVANATLITALTPVIVLPIAARFFGERITRRAVLFGAVSVIGVVAVVVGAAPNGSASLSGDLLAVGDLVAFTAFFLEIKRQRTAGLPAMPLLAGVMLTAAIAVTPVVLVTDHDLTAIGGWDWLWLLLLVFGVGALGHGLMAWAHRHVDVTISSLLTLGSPVISALGAWLVFSQSLTTVQLVGAALVLLGLVGVVVASPRPAAEAAIDTT